MHSVAARRSFQSHVYKLCGVDLTVPHCTCALHFGVTTNKPLSSSPMKSFNLRVSALPNRARLHMCSPINVTISEPLAVGYTQPLCIDLINSNQVSDFKMVVYIQERICYKSHSIFRCWFYQLKDLPNPQQDSKEFLWKKDFHMSVTHSIFKCWSYESKQGRQF